MFIRNINFVIIILFLLLAACKAEDNSDTYPPTLMESSPADGAISVNANTIIALKFTEQIIIISNPQVTLNNKVVSVTLTPRTLTINAILEPNSSYTLIIPANTISDVAGNYAKEIKITFTTLSVTAFNISTSLVTPNPTTQTVNLYNFLKQSFGTKVISGTMANHSTNIIEATWVHTQTGKWPAMTFFDLIDHTNLNQNWINYSAPLTLSKDWWNNNGVVGFSWHWRDPLTKSGSFYVPSAATSPDKGTTFDILKVSDTNSAEYKAMIVDIDVIAGYLKEFKDAEIPVIWRPLHEASGAWFWWGAGGPEPCKALWKLMFDRLVNFHGLNNLIWVWTSDTKSSALNWYPGDEYVDIIGMDIYPGANHHESQYLEFNKIKEIFKGKKIIALTECGSVPDPALMKSTGDMWSWFMPWNGDFTESDNHNGVNWWKKFFNYDFVITRDKMPNLK